MAIRVEHQASPVAVGMAAYAAGRGKARARTQQQLLEIAKQQSTLQARRMGPGYRRYLSGRHQGGGVVPGATIDDPAQGASPAKRVRINAQREANARAMRLGKAAPYPEARARMVAPPDAAQQRAQQDREFKLEAEERQGNLDFFEMRDAETKAEIDRIRKATGGVFADDPEMRAAWKSMDQVIDVAKADKDGDGVLSPTERYQARIEARQNVIGLYNPEAHDVLPENRPGYERITDDGRLIRKGLDGEDEDLGPAPWSRLTPEQRERVKANRRSRFDVDPQTGRPGQWKVDARGHEYFEPGEPKEEPADPSSISRDDYMDLYFRMRDALATDANPNPDPDDVHEAVNEVLSRWRSVSGSGPPAPGAGSPERRFDATTGDVQADEGPGPPAPGAGSPATDGGPGPPAPGAGSPATDVDPQTGRAGEWKVDADGVKYFEPALDDADPFGVRAHAAKKAQQDQQLAPAVQAPALTTTSQKRQEPGLPEAAGPVAPPPAAKALPSRTTPPPRPGRPGWETWAARTGLAELPVVRTPEELAALPPGAEFVDKLGRRRRKN